ncbi:hypothetical protein QIW57_08620 [Francisellaceae bacterium CB52]
MVVSKGSVKTSYDSSYILKPFASTWGAITNRDDTWGSQDRTGQWYLGVQANGFVNRHPNVSWIDNGASGGWNGIVGYNVNKYFAVQYNQFASYGGMFGGLAEGVMNFSNDSMITPYAAGGAGWANIVKAANRGGYFPTSVTGAWDVGGGLKFELSRHVQATVDYRYIQTIGSPDRAYGIYYTAGTHMIGGGLTWFFGGDDANASTANIQDNGAKTVAETPDMTEVEEAK